MFKQLLVLLLSISLVFAAPINNAKKNVGLDLCPTCVNLMNDSIDELVKIIDGGVLSSCSAVCGMLSSQILQVACDLVCSFVGIDEFSKILSMEDPEPIYTCELMKVCPVRMTANGTITEAVVSPANGTIGTTFSIGVAYQITSQIGTGQVAVTVLPPNPEAEPFGGAELLVDTQPGAYSAQLQFTAQQSEQEPFTPGTYIVNVAVCEGACYSPHKYSAVLSSYNTTFTISGSGSESSSSDFGFSSSSQSSSDF